MYMIHQQRIADPPTSHQNSNQVLYILNNIIVQINIRKYRRGNQK